MKVEKGPKNCTRRELLTAGRMREAQSRGADCWLHERGLERRSRAVLALREGAGSADLHCAGLARERGVMSQFKLSDNKNEKWVLMEFYSTYKSPITMEKLQ
jgi:hypothetical protein